MKRVQKLFFLFFCCSTFLAHAIVTGTFVFPPTPIVSSPASTSSAVYSCYNNRENQTFFTWLNSSGNPVFAFYNHFHGTVSNPIQLSSSVGFQASNPTYNSQKNQVIFAWSSLVGTGTYNLYFAIYDCNTNSFGPEFQINTSLAEQAIYSCYNSQNNQVIFSWADKPSGGQPYYAIYDCNQQTLSTPVRISTVGAQPSVYCSYNSRNNQVFFSYQATAAYFSILDCRTNLITQTQIASNSSSVIYSCYNSENNQMFFTYGNSGDGYYAIYNCNTGILASPVQFATNLNLSPSCTYASLTNEVFFNFDQNNQPSYIIYDCNSGLSTSTAFVSTLTSGSDLFASYSELENQISFSWRDQTTNYPYFAVYDEPLPSVVAKNRLVRSKGYSRYLYMKGVSHSRE